MIKEINDLVTKLNAMVKESLSKGNFDLYMDMLSDLTILKNSLSSSESDLLVNLEVQEVLNKYSGVLV